MTESQLVTLALIRVVESTPYIAPGCVGSEQPHLVLLKNGQFDWGWYVAGLESPVSETGWTIEHEAHLTRHWCPLDSWAADQYADELADVVAWAPVSSATAGEQPNMSIQEVWVHAGGNSESPVTREELISLLAMGDAYLEDSQLTFDQLSTLRDEPITDTQLKTLFGCHARTGTPQFLMEKLILELMVRRKADTVESRQDIRAFIDEVHKVQEQDRRSFANTLCVQGYDDQGNMVVSGHRSSADAAADQHLQSSFLDFHYAVARGVEINTTLGNLAISPKPGDNDFVKAAQTAYNAARDNGLSDSSATIQAIKAVRDKTGWGLVESKDYVNRIFTQGRAQRRV